MGKRSNFERVARDLYDTPYEAVVPLTPHLSDVTLFCEPCAGRGALRNHLEALGYSSGLAIDLTPAGRRVGAGDALSLDSDDLVGHSHIITNPPWPAARASKGEPTMGLIRHLSGLRPTWMLLGADFAHNDYAVECLRYCTTIVSIGRVRWMPGTKMQGYENAAWYRFDQNMSRRHALATIFHGRHRGGPIYSHDIEALL